MPIITLTTDLGLQDHYVAVVKGAILSGTPDATIVDVSHLVTPFDHAQAAFILRHAYKAFPKGSIHIIGVNPDADRRTLHLVVRHDGHFFIGADTGVFHLLFEGQPQDAFEITMKLDSDLPGFAIRTVFAQAACHLARGGTPEVIGRRVEAVREQRALHPAVDDSAIRGQVVHVDGYGNAVTNIKRELFERAGRSRPFRISLGRSRNDIERIDKTYGDVPVGERVAIFGMEGYLELAVNKGVEGSGGGLARLFSIRVNDPVRVEFSDRER